MAISVNKDVFGLQVSEKNVFRMDMLNAQDKLGTDELGLLFLEELVRVQLLSQISEFAELHDHV